MTEILTPTGEACTTTMQEVLSAYCVELYGVAASE